MSKPEPERAMVSTGANVDVRSTCAPSQRRRLGWLRQIYRTLYREGRNEIPRHEVPVLTTREFLDGEQWARSSLQLRRARRELPPLSGIQQFAIVATCLNEVGEIGRWLDSLLRQTVPASEVVLCDGGSTDGTLDRVRCWQERHPEFPLRVIVERGAKIARGRNIAVAAASHDLVVLSDVGAPPAPHWAEFLIRPLAADPHLTGAMGWYEVPPDETPFRRAVCSLILPRLEDLDPKVFLPSARSFALRRIAWRAVGGFPEHLTRAGEDTLFDYHLKRHFSTWAFLPEATVTWRPPRRLFRTVFSYARGDAEGGELFWGHYCWILREFGVLAAQAAILLGTLALATISPLAVIPIAAVTWWSASRVRRIVSHYLREPLGPTSYHRILRVSSVLFVATAQCLGFIRGVGSSYSRSRAKYRSTRR